MISFQPSLREEGGEILIIIKGWSMCKWGRGELTKASKCSQWGTGQPGRNQQADEGLGSHTDAHQEALGRDLIHRQTTEEMHFPQGPEGAVTCLFYLPKPLKIFGLRARLEKRIQPAKTLWAGQTVCFQTVILTSDSWSEFLCFKSSFPLPCVQKNLALEAESPFGVLTIKKDTISLTSQLHLACHRNYISQ